MDMNSMDMDSMDMDSMMNMDTVDFSNMKPEPFLLGLLSSFDNRYQACADKFFEEITWKQFFAIICVNLCKSNPTINELSEVMGTSHQNVKQILLKLERVGFVQMMRDEDDKRKQRIVLTAKCKKFCEEHEEGSACTIARIFEGIDDRDILVTIKTILAMEKNLIR